MNFNLIATTHRGLEHEASSELFALLTQIGDEAPDVMRTRILGLLVAKTNLQPIKVIEELRKIIMEDPLRIRYLLRLIPIDAVVDTDIEKIVDAVSSLALRIEKNNTFRVTVEKRRTSLSSSDIIHSVANIIDRSVNLENPDWIILIEIIGRFTGVSVIKPNQILNVIKVIRGESSQI
ncbi:MAG: THUMP domain-containing protein [archaeon]|nr:THUMP domain-containing protein [archaeon]